MIPENKLSEKNKNDISKIKELDKKVDRENLVYRTNEFSNNKLFS